MVAGFLFCLFVYVSFFFSIENQFFMFQALKGKQNLGVFRAVFKQLAGYQRLAISAKTRQEAGRNPSLPPALLEACAPVPT